MAKKKNNVSINALEKHCKVLAPEVIEKTISTGDEEITFEIKPRLSLEECMRFVEDVVSESVRADDLMLIPIAREFIMKKSVLTYYSNFTMPADMNRAFELVMGATDIIDAILEAVDEVQYGMIYRAIDERIEFEKRKMVALQELKVNDTIAQVNQFIARMSGLFEGVNGDQMAKFVSELSQSKNITARDLAAAVANATQEKA